MLKERARQFIKYKEGTNSDISVVRADLFCDEASDLPAVDALPGTELDMGSIAYVIDIGVFYVLNSSGEWLPQNGGSSSSQDDTTPDEVEGE